MELIFKGISWLISKLTIIIFWVVLLTILFTTSNLFGGLAQQLWDQFSGKDVQEVVYRLNNDINKLNDNIKDLERITAPQIKIELEREKNNIEFRIKEECETEVQWHEFYRLDKHWLKEQQKPACEALKDSQAYFGKLYEKYIERDKQLRELERQLGQKLIQLKDLEPKLGGVQKLLMVNFQENWTNIFYIIAGVLLANPLWKVLFFYGVAPFANKNPPIQLTDPVTDGNIFHKKAEKVVNVKVDQISPLCVRMNYASQEDDDSLTTRTRLFWKWSAPFISYASGLFALTEFSSKSPVEDGTVVLSSKKDSSYIIEIELHNHHGLVIHPAYIVGISGNIQVKTQWVWSFHSWLGGQHRYIIFYGTGKLYLEGNEEIYVKEPSITGTRVKSNLLIGFDSQLLYSTKRTRPFCSYFWDKVPLIDVRFSGKGVFLTQKKATVKVLTPIEKNFQFISNLPSIVGKFFGF
jgi:uncharacterized protein (AIM24 family)